jgi:predicted nucleic acid-binding protein
MTTKIFLDTDIVLDLLLERQPFYTSASKVFALADRKLISLFVSSVTFVNTNYVLCSHIGEKAAKSTLRNLKIIVTILPVDEKIVGLALNSEFKDFEDAIQHFTATENGIKVLLSRNIKDYKHAQLRVITADEFIVINSK